MNSNKFISFAIVSSSSISGSGLSKKKQQTDSSIGTIMNRGVLLVLPQMHQFEAWQGDRVIMHFNGQLTCLWTSYRAYHFFNRKWKLNGWKQVKLIMNDRSK